MKHDASYYIPDDISEPLRDTSYAADGYTCYDCVHCLSDCNGCQYAEDEATDECSRCDKFYCGIDSFVSINKNNCRMECDKFRKGL